VRAPYRCSRRYQEGVFTAHTISTRVPLMRGEQQVKAPSLHRPLERGTIDQRRTWEHMVTEVAGGLLSRQIIAVIRHLVVAMRCGTRTAQRMRQDPHRLASKWLGMCASLFTSENISCIDGEGAMGPFARPRAPREQHRRDTANHRCAWVQVREEDYLL